MSGIHQPIRKIRGKANGVGYAGIGTNWRFGFGQVIVVAENTDVLATICQLLEERPEFQKLEPELCKEVAVFQLTDVEVA